MIVLLLAGIAGIAAVSASAVLQWRATSYAPELMRTNVRGLHVPAILGDALVAGSLTGIAVLVVIEEIVGEVLVETPAVVVVTVIMWAAGAWDDRRGDERPRGFRGHLAAARAGMLTGGLLKIFAGASSGLLAAWIVYGWDSRPGVVIQTALLVGLGANLLNLFDRAPGRAAKVGFLIGIPLVAFGSAAWAASAVPLLGALVLCIGRDLREREMLGDAGANPLGAVLGLGLALSLGPTGRVIAIVILGALNVASERWSFSKAIEATPPLRWLDGLGRAGQPSAK